MKILKSWLKDYIDFDLNDEVLAKELSLKSVNIEEIIKGIHENVVVAEIKEVLPHPNADRLRIAKVFDGKNELTIVCGAPNIAPGQKVPLATIGSVLPGDFIIKKTAIRGIESEGMLCAEDELGLGEDHSGILVLPEKTEVGQKFSEAMAQETIFDIEITPNRGDELSHIGVAREIGAILSKHISLPEIEIPAGENTTLEVEIEDEDLCPQYYALPISEVKFGPSPEWLQKRLIACGIKPISNIVDITNYIMLDLGQPLHAFDASKVKDNKIIVRVAAENEEIVTLDGSAKILTPENLIIADAEKPIAIAGVMGGANSEIDENTKDIILEAAEFNPVSIRKTAKRLGFMTEASYRFERGIDSGHVRYALEKAGKMVLDLAGGKLGQIVSAGSEPQNKSIDIKYNNINALLGTDLGEDEINGILTSLGFEITNSTATIPSWRHDVSIWQDLAEEIGRIYGYDQIKNIAVPTSSALPHSDYYIKEKIKDILTDAGFTENLSYAFYSEEDTILADIPKDTLLELKNPLQLENKYLKNSLIPNLVKAISKNGSFDPVLFFEIGHVFTKEDEKINLAIITAGKKAKGYLEQAAAKLAEILKFDEKSLTISELNPDKVTKYKVRKPSVYYIEITLDQVLKDMSPTNNDTALSVPEKNPHYRPISKYPALTRDLAFIVKNNIDAKNIIEEIYSVSDQINRVELFDEFESDKFGKDMKNIAYHIYLQHMEKTMTDQEADQIINKIIKKIENIFNAKLRDK